MMTFADLKRDLSVGVKVKRISRFGQACDIVKTVSKVQTNGVYLEGSMLQWPPASLVEYDGVSIKIYAEGLRDLTDKEKMIIANQPSNRPENAKQCEIDIMTDGSQMFWADKRYYSELNARYLKGSEWENGEKYDYNTQKILSKKIKGELILQYVILRDQAVAA